MSKIYQNMDDLFNEFVSKAANLQCGKYKLPESVSRTWCHDKGKKYHYHSAGANAGASTLNFSYENYDDVYQSYFANNVAVNFNENAYGRSNFPAPLNLEENGMQEYSYTCERDSSSTTSNSVSYTNSITAGVTVTVGGAPLSVEGSVEVGHSTTASVEESNTTGQSSQGTFTWHWDESHDMYPDGFQLLWGVNHYKLQTNPDAKLETTYTIDLNKGFDFGITCGYKRDGNSHTKHTTLHKKLLPVDLGYGSNQFKVIIPTKYNVDYNDAFPTIQKKPLNYIS